jgi:hypothetical protein
LNLRFVPGQWDIPGEFTLHQCAKVTNDIEEARDVVTKPDRDGKAGSRAQVFPLSPSNGAPINGFFFGEVHGKIFQGFVFERDTSVIDQPPTGVRSSTAPYPLSPEI